MSATEWSLPAAFDVVAGAAPDRTALAWKSTRRSYELREFTARAIARFKAPRAIAFCERVARHASGKADTAGRARSPRLRCPP